MKLINYLKANKTKVRIFYWLSFTLMMVFVILPMFFFFYLFNEAEVRQIVIQQFDSKNYNVEILGMVRPKFWHGLSFELDNMIISNKGHQELLGLKTINCQLSWFNLIAGQYRVKRISINGVDIKQQVVDQDGLANLINFSNTDQMFFSNLSNIIVSNISMFGTNVKYPIKNGTIKIMWDNGLIKFSSGLKLTNNDLYLALYGNIDSMNNNVIKFSNVVGKAYNEDVSISTMSTANYNVKTQELSLNDLAGDVELKQYKGTVGAKNMQLSLNGVVASDVILKIGSGDDFLKQYTKILINKLSSDSYKNLMIDQMNASYLLTMGQSHLNIDSALNDFSFNNNVIDSKCSSYVLLFPEGANSKGASANLAGKCSYDLNEKRFDFNLTGTLIDEPLQLALQITDHAHKPYIVATGKIDNLDLSRFNVIKDKISPILSDSNKLPFAWLSLWDMDANLEIKKFILDRISLSNVSTQFKLANNELNINKIHASLYGGTVSGKVKITKLNNDKYDITAVQNLDDLNLQEVLQDWFNISAISGKAAIGIDTTMKGVTSYNDIGKHLNGKIELSASKGSFNGVDFSLFVNPKSSATTLEKSTIFDVLSANFDFASGKSSDGSIMFSSPYVIAAGGGLLDFVNMKLNYKLEIKSALPKNEEKISSILIPVVINGDIFAPKVIIQNIHLVSDAYHRHSSDVSKKRKFNRHKW